MKSQLAILIVAAFAFAACSGDEKKPASLPLSNAMLTAIANDDEEAVAAYLAKGGDPNAKDQEDGETAVWHAASASGGKCLQLLLEAGADPSICTEGGLPPLAMAVSSGYRHNVQLLLNNGADPNQVGYAGATVVVIAASRGKPEILQLLMDHGGDPLKASGTTGSALTVAAGMGSVRDPECERLRIILDHIGPEGDVDAPGAFGMTALMHAAMMGNVDAVRLLLEHGADPNKVGIGGATALGYATVMSHADVGRLLVERGANVNVKGAGGITPLHHAARDMHIEYLKELVEAGATTDVKDANGNTPLHLAASGGDLPGEEEDRRRVINLLLAAGADRTIANNEGKLPADVACYPGLTEILRAKSGE